MKHKTSIYKLISLFVCISLISSSCSSICRGTMQDIAISSYPDNAEVYVDDQFCGYTPQVVSVSRKYSHHVLLYKPGFQEEHYYLNPSYNPMLAGNLVFSAAGAGIGALVGLSIAHGTGPFVGVAMLVCAGFGAVVGTGIAAGGIGFDLISGAGYKLNENQINTLLKQQISEEVSTPLH